MLYHCSVWHLHISIHHILSYIMYQNICYIFYIFISIQYIYTHLLRLHCYLYCSSLLNISSKLAETFRQVASKVIFGTIAKLAECGRHGLEQKAGRGTVHSIHIYHINDCWVNYYLTIYSCLIYIQWYIITVHIFI